jgi:hypothetical protein
MEGSWSPLIFSGEMLHRMRFRGPTGPSEELVGISEWRFGMYAERRLDRSWSGFSLVKVREAGMEGRGCFALLSAGYVLRSGWENGNSKTYTYLFVARQR